MHKEDNVEDAEFTIWLKTELSGDGFQTRIAILMMVGMSS